MTFINPPHSNGIMQLTDEEKATITEKLNVIVNEFVPTMDNPEITTFYIAAKYNQQNVDFPINGDTAEFLLKQEVVSE